MNKYWKRKNLYIRNSLSFVYGEFGNLDIRRIRFYGKLLGLILAIAIFLFLFFLNFSPFNFTTFYSLQTYTKRIINLEPVERIVTGKYKDEVIYGIYDDLIYFTTEMKLHYDTATVKLIYRNDNKNQNISLGYNDYEAYHYKTKPFESPLLNNFSWSKVGDDLVLYQKEKKYDSVEEFLKNPPKDAIIGTYEYAAPFTDTAQTYLADYQPSDKETVINTALRSKHTMYAYLDKERFNMTVTKQDLNWYEGADEMKVKIYKDDLLVYEGTVEDDGDDTNSQQSSTEQQLEINNPSEELPEPGVYKIDLEASGDSVIKQIRTNLHKIVFSDNLFLLNNKEAYPTISASTEATTLYTDALNLSALTYHKQGMQNIFVGRQVLGVNAVQKKFSIIPREEISRVYIPQNDLIINGYQGYFAFDKNSFFKPTKYYTQKVTDEDDLLLVDYLLTEYKPATTTADGWQVNEQTFDLKDAYIKDNKLSWLIKAPGLKENKGSIIIKDIEVTFYKKGWL